MKNIIEISKIELQEGEELRDLPSKVMEALARNKSKIKRSLAVTHIFNDHIVTVDTETKKKFRLDMTRDEGSISLDNPTEVRAVFIPVKQKTTKVDVETGATNNHKHTAMVDESGNGQTSENNDHKHLVRGWNVLPETPQGGHTHELQKPTNMKKADSYISTVDLGSDVLIMLKGESISDGIKNAISDFVTDIVEGTEAPELVEVKKSFWQGRFNTID